MAEEALVQGLRVLPSSGQPGGDGTLSKAKDSLGGRRIQAFSQGSQHHGDLPGGGFQTVQGSVAPGSEGGAAGLATKGLDPFGLPMLAISNKGVELSIGDPKVPT